MATLTRRQTTDAPTRFTQEPSNELPLSPTHSESSGHIPFECQLAQINRIVHIKAHNRDLVVKKNGGNISADHNLSRNNSNGNSISNTKSMNSNSNNLMNININNMNGVAAMNYKNNSKGRRQNQIQNQNLSQNQSQNISSQYPSNINMNSINSTNQLYTSNNQRKYNYFNNSYNNKKNMDQQNAYPNINTSVNLLQQLQKQQHQQQFEQQQNINQQQYNLNSNQNFLESFLFKHLNNQTQFHQNQFQQQTPTYQNQFNTLQQTLPSQSYNSQSPLLFDYTINTNKEVNDIFSSSSLLSDNINNTNSLSSNNINQFSNTNNITPFQQETVSAKSKLNLLAPLSIQSIVEQQDITSSNATTPCSISRPNSSITSLGSSAASSHLNSDQQDNNSSPSNLSGKSTLVDPLESIWKRDRNTLSGKKSQAVNDFSLENTYFNDADKLKASGLLGTYFT